MTEFTWDINEAGTHEAWLDLWNEQEGLTAGVKFDGCIHLHRYFNGSWIGADESDDVCYMHICDVDKMIDALTKIRAMAKEHFGEEWPQ